MSNRKRQSKKPTTDQAFRLGCLLGTSGDIIKAASSVIRDGYTEPSNTGRLLRADLEVYLGDLLATMQIMGSAGDINVQSILDMASHRLGALTRDHITMFPKVTIIYWAERHKYWTGGDQFSSYLGDATPFVFDSAALTQRNTLEKLPILTGKLEIKRVSLGDIYRDMRADELSQH